MSPPSIERYTIAVVSPCDGVGKTSLCIRFVTDFFTEEYDPTQDDGYYRKKVSVDGEEVFVDVLDIISEVEESPGATSLRSAARNRDLLEADGLMLVCSIDDPERMYEAMLRMQESIRKTLGNKENVQFVTVGTKLDLEGGRLVQKEEVAGKMKDLGCTYFEVSVKDGVNVNEPFFELIRSIRKSRPTPTDIKRFDVAVSRRFPKRCCLM